MYEKIMVSLDGSEMAEQAIPYAKELAHRLNAELIGVGVEEFRANDALGYMPEQRRRPATTEPPARFGMVKYLQNLTSKVDGITPVSLVGHVADEIVEYADTNDVGIIIMASHGRSGIRRWTLGSVADKVARSAKQPVLIIRCGEKEPAVCASGMMRTILVPLDGSAESEAVVPSVIDLASALGAQVYLFRIVAWPEHVIASAEMAVRVPYAEEETQGVLADVAQYLGGIAQRFQQKGIVVMGQEVKVGKHGEERINPADAIINQADQISADMVAMSTHGRSGVSRWALGSVATKVLHAGNRPLLLVRTSAHMPA